MSSLDRTLAGLKKSEGFSFFFPPRMQAASCGSFSLDTSALLFLWNFCCPWNLLPPTIRRTNNSTSLGKTYCLVMCAGAENEEEATLTVPGELLCAFVFGGNLSIPLRVLGINPSLPEKLPHYPEEQGVISFVPLPDRYLAFILLTIHEPPIPGT